MTRAKVSVLTLGGGVSFDTPLLAGGYQGDPRPAGPLIPTGKYRHLQDPYPILRFFRSHNAGDEGGATW